MLPPVGTLRSPISVDAVGVIRMSVEAISTERPFVASQLPDATVGRTVYHGPYEGLGAAWREFEAWITSEGYTTAANLWECYVAGPESNPDPATWRTELNRPLTR